MAHPYQSQPKRAFWKTGARVGPDDMIAGLFHPKFTITPDTRIATAGSCFAQHIGAALRGAGCTMLDAEPPIHSMSQAVATRFGYGIYAARYGNIYSSRQLLQLLEEVRSGEPDPHHIWTRDGRFFDALRPMVEPQGLASAAEVMAHRAQHLSKMAEMLQETDVFIFTPGLTESWMDRAVGRIYPVCPGVIAGTFDAEHHALKQFTHAEILTDLAAIQTALQDFQPKVKLLLTVSPVPLVATAGADHVIVASAQAKATLRSAIGEHVRGNDAVDYFPSFEIVTSSATSGPWFAADQRNVSAEGIARVTTTFLTAYGLPHRSIDGGTPQAEDDDDQICEEMLLQAFAR